MASPTSYDHVSLSETEYPDGIYRVVGTSDESVTLLRVGEPDGRRVNTGEVVTVDTEEFASLESAENPDGNRPLGEAVVSIFTTSYWSIWAFARNLVASPLPALVAITLLFVGVVGPGTGFGPEVVFSVLTIVGGLALALVGAGRV